MNEMSQNTSIAKLKMKSLVILFFLFTFSSYGSITNKNYLSIQSQYNYAYIPSYYNHAGYTRWSEKYFKYYNNNISGSLIYTTGKNRILFQNGFSFEGFSFSSDTAVGFESCINGTQVQKFTKYGSGKYFCLYSGIELFPLKRFLNFSFNSGISIGYDSNAASYDEIIIGCIPGVIDNNRKLFVGVNIGFNGYIPINENFDILPCIRYQFRINKLNHVDLGIGIGIRYKFRAGN